MIAPRRKQTRVLEHLLKDVRISKGDRADTMLEGRSGQVGSSEMAVRSDQMHSERPPNRRTGVGRSRWKRGLANDEGINYANS